MNKLKLLKRIVIYIRVSSEKQVDNYSLDMQEKILKQYAKANDMTVVKVFREEGRSGTNINRPAYLEMRSFILDNQIDAVVVHKADRLHRNELNYFKDIEYFRNHNIALIAVADGIDSRNEESNLLMAVQAALSANFSRNLSNETRKGLLAGAENCQNMGGLAPYGMCVNKDTGLLEIDEVTAPAVRKIFELYVDGFSASEICKWLKEHGYKTNRGNDFKPNSLNSILHNEKYRGCYTWDKATPKDSEGRRNGHKYKENYIKIEDGCPAIVSDEIFFSAQERLTENRNKAHKANGRHYYSLNSLIFCKCGNRMSGNVQYSGDNKYYQYRCSAKCGCKPIRADKLENAVFSVLAEALFSAPNQKQILSTMNDIAYSDKLENKKVFQQLRAKESGLKTAENNLFKAIETGKATTAIMNRLDRISKEYEQIQAKLKNFYNSSQNITPDDMKILKNQFVDYMCKNNSVNARQLLKSTIKSIIVDNENVTVNLKEGVAIGRKFKEYVREPLTDVTITLFLYEVYKDLEKHKVKCWFSQEESEKLLPVSIPVQKVGEVFGENIEEMVGKLFDVTVKVNEDCQIRKVTKLAVC